MTEPTFVENYPAQFQWLHHPFSDQFETRFLFMSPSVQRSLEVLNYAVSSDQWVVVTGEAGVGKTTLMRAFGADVVDRSLSVYFFDSHESERGRLWQWLFSDDDEKSDELLSELDATNIRQPLLQRINLCGDCVLIWDHFPTASKTAKSDLILLREQTIDIPMFHIFVVPDDVEQGALLYEELAGFKLPSDDMTSALNRPGVLRCHVDAMTADETEQYASFRLAIAGWQRRPDITRGAWQEIYGLSEGRPQDIHQHMNKIMQSVAEKKTTLINSQLVHRVLSSEDSSIPVMPDSVPPAIDPDER
ncbi:MAG: hypothetical protein HKM24_08090 [Gammaproteobacteria bacterium]|nr:hypothetical protein [Gammaproteobacteria bacterium]